MGNHAERQTGLDLTEVCAGIPFGVILFNPDTSIAHLNSSALEMFGFTSGEIAGQTLASIITSHESNSELGDILLRMKEETQRAEIPTGEAVGQSKNGRPFAIHLSHWDLPTQFKNLSAVIVRDIHEESERDARYRMLFETSDYPQLIIINHKFEFANEAAVRAFGCDSVDDLKSIHPSQISPEFQPDGRDSFSKAEEMIGIAYETGGHRFDWVHTKKNGTEMLMDVILTSMPHMGSDALYCGYRDITERQKTEDVLRRTQKMDAIGQLTGGIAHDYNNILGIIKGNLELLKRKLPNDKFAQDRIRAALVGTVRGADITRKLLAFSHEKSRGNKRININQPLREFETLIGKTFTASVAISLGLAKDLWPVEVDPGDFDNVVLNLALNARDAMPDGGNLSLETINVSLDEQFVADNDGAHAGDFVMMTVSDTGHGMSDEIKEKIFEPFFTTKPEGKGTGLGMSMVYGFVQQSNGFVKIETAPDEGTTFHLYLPRATGNVAIEDTEDADAFILPRGSETVLVVDDEQGLLDVTCAQLEDLGYTTIRANSGQEAMDVLAKCNDIQAMFSDVVMPGGINGYQLADMALKANPSLKVQLASGFTKQCEEDAAAYSSETKSLSEALLKKPFNQRELAVSLRCVLDEDVI